MFCGEPEYVEITEIYGVHEFDLGACCTAMYDQAVDYLNDDPRAAAKWLGQSLGGNELGLGDMRRVVDVGGQLQLDWSPRIVPVTWAEAKAFVDTHHRHNASPRGWRYGAALHNGGERIGVVMVGRPVARLIDASRVVEVNRLCIRTDVPPEFAWNGCSMLYSWAAKEARARGYEKVITYTRADEVGTSLRAAGWQVDGRTKGRHWHAPSRPRAQTADVIDKVRWARDLGRQATRKAA